MSKVESPQGLVSAVNTSNGIFATRDEFFGKIILDTNGKWSFQKLTQPRKPFGYQIRNFLFWNWKGTTPPDFDLQTHNMVDTVTLTQCVFSRFLLSIVSAYMRFHYINDIPNGKTGRTVETRNGRMGGSHWEGVTGSKTMMLHATGATDPNAFLFLNNYLPRLDN